MLQDLVSWIALVAILASSAGVVLGRDWRWSLSLLAAQYLAAFWLAAQHLPVGMASAKLVTGWMAVGVLGMTRLAQAPAHEAGEAFWPRRRAFHFLLVGIVAVLAAAVSPGLAANLSGLGLHVVAGSVILVAMGLVNLGLTSDSLHSVIGLLTVLCGFELIYAAVEGSILVAGLLALVTMGLALVGGYLLVAGAEDPAT